MRPAPVRLAGLSRADARAHLATGAPVYLFVNPLEYHGPHLPLCTDALISEGIVAELHERLAARHPEWPLLHGGTLVAGVEPVPGPGTRGVSYTTLCREVRDACCALADLGATRVVLSTFHGMPLHNLALETGVRYLRARGVRALAPLHLLLQEMLALEPAEFPEAFAHLPDAGARAAVADELGSDFHAGFFETSMALHYVPEEVSPRYRELPACPRPRLPRGIALAARLAGALGREKLAAELLNVAQGIGWYGLRPFPSYTGRPALAAASAGRVFAEAIVSRYAEAAEAVLVRGDAPPAPIMGWTKLVTLGGRVGLPRPR